MHHQKNSLFPINNKRALTPQSIKGTSRLSLDIRINDLRNGVEAICHNEDLPTLKSEMTMATCLSWQRIQRVTHEPPRPRCPFSTFVLVLQTLTFIILQSFTNLLYKFSEFLSAEQADEPISKRTELVEVCSVPHYYHERNYFSIDFWGWLGGNTCLC